MDTDRDDCLAAGMNAHVGKPFVMEDVVATILRHTRGGSNGAQPLAVEPEPTPAELPPFDRASAIERLGGDEELLEHVLPVFRGNLRTAAQQLEGPVRLPPADLERLVHTIKGMAGNLGAAALAAAAAEAESRVAAGDGEASVREVAREIQAALAAIDRWSA
jgi:HPt (histidine-containing phosphotransfer) domain-containing protein